MAAGVGAPYLAAVHRATGERPARGLEAFEGPVDGAARRASMPLVRRDVRVAERRLPPPARGRVLPRFGDGGGRARPGGDLRARPGLHDDLARRLRRRVRRGRRAARRRGDGRVQVDARVVVQGPRPVRGARERAAGRVARRDFDHGARARRVHGRPQRAAPAQRARARPRRRRARPRGGLGDAARVPLPRAALVARRREGGGFSGRRDRSVARQVRRAGHGARVAERRRPARGRAKRAQGLEGRAEGSNSDQGRVAQLRGPVPRRRPAVAVLRGDADAAPPLPRGRARGRRRRDLRARPRPRSFRPESPATSRDSFFPTEERDTQTRARGTRAGESAPRPLSDWPRRAYVYPAHRSSSR